MSNKHFSVLLNESIENLNIKEDGIYVDCTLGYAGHSSQILKRITRGCLFAFDQDGEAIDYSRRILDQISNNYEIINSNFVNIKSELNDRGITKVDGILFDFVLKEREVKMDLELLIIARKMGAFFEGICYNKIIIGRFYEKVF